MVTETADNSGPGIRVCRSSTSQQLKREEIGYPTFLLRRILGQTLNQPHS